MQLRQIAAPILLLAAAACMPGITVSGDGGVDWRAFVSLSAPQTIASGQSAQLIPHFIVGSGEITPGIGAVMSDVPYTVTPATTTIYTLSVTVNGVTISSSAMLTVTTVTAPVSVAISPTSASLQTGASQKFQATVSNSTDTVVAWSVQEIGGGSIAADGTYAAPATAGTYHVVARCHVDSTKSASAALTVTAPATGGLVISSPLTLDKTSVMAGQTLNGSVTYQNTGSSAISVNWISIDLRPPGGTHTGGPYYNLAPQVTTAQVIQPGGSVTLTGSRAFTSADPAGTWESYATYQDAGAAWHDGPSLTFGFSQSAGIAVTVTPSAPSTAPGGTINFQASVTGTTTGQSTAVTWSVQEAGGGTVSSTGVYTAPATMGTYHVVATSMADTTKTGTAAATVAPPPPIAVSISPSVTSVLPAGTATFSATVTGITGGQSSAVTWSVLELGGGTVDASGHYTAPATEGTYHVLALSVADPSKSGTASVTVSTAAIIATDRRTTWNPGLNAVGGIPNRTTIYRTLSPSGGDDTGAIQAALNGCPADQVVKLNAGTFNINGNGLSFRTSDCTLRGSGTGTPGSGAGGTRLIKADRATNPSYAILYVGYDPSQFSSSINLASDAVKGSNSVTLVSNPGIQVGEIVLIDHNTNNDPQVFWGPNHDGPGGGSRRWFVRQDRSLNQMMEVTAVNGTTITFATPFHITFQTLYAAQLSRYAQPVLHRTGVEDIYFYGGQGGDWHGNVPMSLCAYCWIKNIEAHWSVGTSVGLYGTYRSELRDSYIHETPDPNPGGAGYMVGLNYGASDNLVENNIMWYGNKVIVMRGTGGGNVVAYNYMDDAFGSNYPNMPEAGLNAGHYTTPHMELLEGNRSHSYQGDAFWGNSIYITIFRNHLTGLRGANGPLSIYTFISGGSTYPYKDLDGRSPVRIEQNSYYHNLVGNVLGFQGQTLLTYSGLGYNYTQTGWTYEALAADPGTVVPMWKIGFGACGPHGCPPWVAQTVNTIQRDGNWDWVTGSQRWHGIGGALGSRTPTAIPNSLYLSQKPAFFGSNPWPWVDPSTGAVYTLPAKARFDAMPR